MTDITGTSSAQSLSPGTPELSKARVDSLRSQYLRTRPRIRPVNVLILALAVLVVIWALSGTQPDMAQITRGKTPWEAVWDFVKGMYPPRFDLETVNVAGIDVTYAKPLRYVAETVQMALVGTLLGVLMSIPFGLLAARNTSPHPVIYQTTRLFLNLVRSVPELIWALIFVAAVGLGPFSGVLALAIAGVGSKGKLYAEAIEAIDPQQVLAVQATGAGPLQSFIYSAVPQATPLILSYSLLSFESNVRAATILGFVGAGGIGFVLYNYMQLFEYNQILGVVIIIVVTVTVIDRFSDLVRRRFI